MMKNRRKVYLITAILVILLGIAVAGLAATVHHRSAGSFSAERATETAPQDVDAVEAAGPSEVLFFASDYQEESGWPVPSETLSGILGIVKAEGLTPDNFIFCGDYTNDSKLHDYQLSPDGSIDEIISVVSSVYSEAVPGDMIFVQGNHDRMTDRISSSGLHEYDDYLVYVLNTEEDFPWKQGRSTEFRDRVIGASAEMKECLDGLVAAGETRPVFIAGHVPLHFTARGSSRHTTGDNIYASYIFDTVNEAAESLDIVYLTGHDHSKGWDCYLGGACIFKAPGETILIPDADAGGANSKTAYADSFTEKILNFTYMNAGYIGYYMNCGPEELAGGSIDQYASADETLTGTVCEIYPDRLVITRYSADGIHQLGGDGTGDPYKGGIDEDLIDSSHYSTHASSPQTIERKRSE